MANLLKFGSWGSKASKLDVEVDKVGPVSTYLHKHNPQMSYYCCFIVYNLYLSSENPSLLQNLILQPSEVLENMEKCNWDVKPESYFDISEKLTKVTTYSSRSSFREKNAFRNDKNEAVYSSIVNETDANVKILMESTQNFSKPLVILHYGPYRAHGIIRYRPQKLYGLVGKSHISGTVHFFNCLRHVNYVMSIS